MGASNHFEHVLSLISHCITSNMNEVLERLVVDKEVLDALEHMDPKKALEIDGLSRIRMLWERMYYDFVMKCYMVIGG